MAKPALPLSCITLIYNKVLNKNFNFPKEQLIDAEKEYQEIRSMVKVTKKDKDVSAIEEMIQCLKTNQPLSAENHAKRVQQAIRILENRLMTAAPKQIGYAEIHGKANKKASSAGGKTDPPDEPFPDYYGADENDQMPERHVKGQYSHSHQTNTAIPNQQAADQAKEMLQNQHVLNQMEKSKEAGERLRKDNPNLTDLSDANRPTKLAEKHSELYDNEWTDAFEELQKKCHLADREAVKCLLEIMTESYKRNCSEATSQFEAVEKEIKRIMTGTADSRTTGERESIEGDTSSLKQYLKSLAKLSNQKLQKTFEDKYLPEILRRHKCRNQRDLPVLLKFTRKCVELTWLMCVQEPPVVLDSLDDYDKFDTNCYKAFTKQGKTVDYYVWPALLLHEGGPLLAKGVAQGK